MKMPSHCIVPLVTGLVIAATTSAQDRPAPGPVDPPLVILIQEGGSIPAQTLMRLSGKTEGIVAVYDLTGGARLDSHDGRRAVRVVDRGEVTVPALTATRAGDDGYLNVGFGERALVQTIRVATVSAEHLREARRLAEMSVAPQVSSAEPLLGEQTAASTGNAIRRVADTFLIVDARRLDRTGWSNDGVVTSYLPAARPEEEPSTATWCVRTPIPPGFIEWTVIANPRAEGHSVKPESSNDLVWGQAPSQNADGRYNNRWPANTAIKIPSHCTDYPAISQCCCNVAASWYFGVCRLADFGGAESGWPRDPLR